MNTKNSNYLAQESTVHKCVISRTHTTEMREPWLGGAEAAAKHKKKGDEILSSVRLPTSCKNLGWEFSPVQIPVTGPPLQAISRPD